jgi:hypothetical protein
MSRAIDPRIASRTLARPLFSSRKTVPLETPMRCPASSCSHRSRSHKRIASSSLSSSRTVLRWVMGMLRGLNTRSPSYFRHARLFLGRAISTSRRYVHMHNTPRTGARQRFHHRTRSPAPGRDRRKRRQSSRGRRRYETAGEGVEGSAGTRPSPTSPIARSWSPPHRLRFEAAGGRCPTRSV